MLCIVFLHVKEPSCLPCHFKVLVSFLQHLRCPSASSYILGRRMLLDKVKTGYLRPSGLYRSEYFYKHKRRNKTHTYSSYTQIKSERSLSAFILQTCSKRFPDAHLLRNSFICACLTFQVYMHQREPIPSRKH